MGGRSFRPGAVATRFASGRLRYFSSSEIAYADVGSSGRNTPTPVQTRSQRLAFSEQVSLSEQDAFEGEACAMCCIRTPYSFEATMPLSCAEAVKDTATNEIIQKMIIQTRSMAEK